jgi:DNA-binding response OmpR family regulator
MMQGQKPLVLVVDDDLDILKLVSVSLRLEGFRVIATADSDEALQLVRDKQPTLVLLDIMMPGKDGFEVCQLIRGFSDLPIIMLTAKASVDDTVRGLDLGADDFVVKPFNVNELAARAKTVLHRTKETPETAQTTYASGELVIDFAQHLVRMGDREAVLPPIEYRLLSLLASNAGRVFTYGHLLTEVWGPEYYGEDIHILEAAVARLRKRLADGAGDHNYIATRRGIGYFFNAPDGEPPNCSVAWDVSQ